jgi:hypothetical protein
MTDDYTFAITQCDVPPERRAALQSYRDKRRLWLSWIDKDEHHAIWQVLSSMVWTDASFKMLSHFAMGDESNALSNTLLGQALIDGHVATQVLAIRRLVDDGRNDIISLRRLIKDLKRNFGLITRENFVCFDGVPYDYEAVQQKEMMKRVGKGAFWGETSGPGAHSTSRMAHEQFDRLSGIRPANRTREDRLPTRLLTTIEAWLADSGADELAKWSHTYLAHAGGPESRKRIADLIVTANKITDAIKALARVTEAISAWLLFAGGRSNSLMPVAQFNPFEKLDRPIMQAGADDDAYKLWHQLSDERNLYLEGVDVELIGCAKSDPSETPREEYVKGLMSAAATGDQEKMEQLCDEEIEATLREIRGSER